MNKELNLIAIDHIAKTLATYYPTQTHSVADIESILVNLDMKLPSVPATQAIFSKAQAHAYYLATARIEAIAQMRHYLNR